MYFTIEGSDCSDWLMAPCGSGLGGFSDESKDDGECKELKPL